MARLFTDDQIAQVIEWIKESDNTNKFCKRCLLIDLCMKLHQEPPDIKGAKKRIMELLPISSRLVEVPSFVKEWGIEE